MNYRAPQRDILFCLRDIHDFVSHYQSLDVALDDELVEQILREASKFSEQELYPLNRLGDTEGVHIVDGRVKTPTGFKAAYQAYVESGWPAIAQAEAHGGQELPISLSLIVQELWQAANQAWSMYAVVTEGTATMLDKFGTEDQKRRYLPKLVSGEWIGTMDITESQAGSDVGLINTRAEAQADGSYRITGNKIFISSGDHDLSENIIHFVLARLTDAPAGSRGLSLFIVPKYEVNEDGSLGALNSMGCSSVEHKMGLKGSATCAMFYEGAKGYLLGEANRGLMTMFVLINKSRLGSAVQGLAQAEGAWQQSLAYAQERVQGRSPIGECKPGGDALITHPDIQRMLDTQRAISDGGRALIYEGLKALDVSWLGSEEEIRQAESKFALFIPVLKGCISEWGFEATDLGIQILGGHGYTQDWGVEQRLRDVRVTRIYEGTTGIQAQDFLLRKVLPNPDAAMDALYGKKVLPGKFARLQHYLDTTRELSRELALTRESLKNGLMEAIAYDYLMLNGYLLLALQWKTIAEIAQEKLKTGSPDESFLNEKLLTAEFYFTDMLPRAGLHLDLVQSRTAKTMPLFAAI